MKRVLVWVLVASVFFCACNPIKHEAKIPVVGENVDSADIAADTLMQKGIESSYEYFKTINISENLAYDVIAYGGPASKGEYAVLRRSEGNRKDTVVHAQRFGIIVNAFTADLNNNGKEEIYVVMRKPAAKGNCYVTAFEFDKNGKTTVLAFRDSSAEQNINTPENGLEDYTDTIYISNTNY